MLLTGGSSYRNNGWGKFCPQTDALSTELHRQTKNVKRLFHLQGILADILPDVNIFLLRVRVRDVGIASDCAKSSAYHHEFSQKVLLFNKIRGQTP
jgi:hypothetical protein